MPMLNIFDNDAFSVLSLTASLETIPYQPSKIERMGLFNEMGMNSTHAAIEQLGNTLMLVPVTPRGGVPPTQPRDRPSLLSIAAPRLAIQDAVYADEVQGVRRFGSETELETVQNLVNGRMGRARTNVNRTIEYHRLGAIKGQLLDANGSSVLLNLYTTFSVTQQTEIDFDLDNASPAAGALQGKMNQAIRQIEDELGGIPYERVHAFAGKTFMDNLTAHPQYTATYQAANAALLRNRTVGVVAEFGGITFEEYRGTVGGVQFVDDNKAIIFPVGVPDLFQTWFAPADYEETVNTMGRPFYAKQEPMRFGRGREIEVQSNPLNICTRPRTVQFARRT